MTARSVRMEAKRRLRVESEEIFELRWSADGWKTVETTQATAVGSCGFYADAVPGAGDRLEFTMYWPARGIGREGITPFC